MKHLFLITLLGFAVNCGGGSSVPNAPASDELHADIIVRPAPDSPVIEITFYRDIVEMLNGKQNKGFGKSVVAVYDPEFNGQPMTNTTNLSGQPIYKISSTNTKANNIITASVGGKKYQGSTILETKQINNMITITLSAVDAGGS